jgi:hypothetical protein
VLVSKEREGKQCCSVSDKDRRVNPKPLLFILEDVYCTRMVLWLGLFRDRHYSVSAFRNCFMKMDIFSQLPPKIYAFWRQLT